MSKLLQRLSDPDRSGVYRVAHERDIRDSLSGSAHDLLVIDLEAGKAQMLSAIAKALDFPAWYGGNWDALEDCLTDLSWRKYVPRVVVFPLWKDSGDLNTLRDVLAAAAEFWRGRRCPFFAVFVDPNGALELPALYKPRPADGQ